MAPGRAILRAIAEGRGPRRYLIAFGYAGWAPGQLESEMAAEDWVTSSAEEAILFDRDYASKWRRAFDAHGISL
jgi:putative transcriptional regulator